MYVCISIYICIYVFTYLYIVTDMDRDTNIAISKATAVPIAPLFSSRFAEEGYRASMRGDER